MAKILLRSGFLDDFQAVGENGQAVFDSALQIRETLRLRKQQLVECLAIPQMNDEGDRVDWYAPAAGAVVSWAAAGNDERKRALRLLESAVAGAQALSQRCQQSEKTAQQLFGALLAKALQFPAANHLFLIDGKPVITFWGFVNLNQNARDDVLDCLRIEEKREPEIVLPPEEPEAEPLKIVLSEPDAPLLAPAPTAAPAPTVAPVVAPAPPPVAEPLAEPVTPTPPVAPVRKRRPLWLLPVAAAVALAIGVPAGWQALHTDAAARPAVSVADIKAVESAPAPVKPVDAPAPLAKPQPGATLPLAEAQVSAPVPEEKPPLAPVAADAPTGVMVMDANQVKAGSTRFLNGAWRVTIDANDPITGKPPSLRYDLKNNKGTVRVTHGDNIVCRAELYAGLHQSGTLMIKSRGNARCSDGSRYPVPEVACKAGDNGVAQCTGRYDEKTVLPLTFKKVSA